MKNYASKGKGREKQNPSYTLRIHTLQGDLSGWSGSAALPSIDEAHCHTEIRSKLCKTTCSLPLLNMRNHLQRQITKRIDSNCG